MTGSGDESVFDTLASMRIVPVVEIVDADTAVPLADALSDGGLRTMEVTLRTPAALEAIHRIATERPGFLVGAGTLLSSADVDAAARAGARFGVAPGFTPALSHAATANDLPFVPGAVTASEVLAAIECGHRSLKFFPAEKSGGVGVLASFEAPFRALGIRFMPTGGVNPANLADYLRLDTVFAVGGTWIAPRGRIAARDFDTIRDTAAGAVASVHAATSAASTR